MKQDFLVEIGCEELPPKALNTLIAAFSDGIKAGLAAANLSHGAISIYSAPRRLAVKVSDLISVQPEQLIEKKGPSVTAAFDQAGQPSPALLGFARSAQVDIKDLIEMEGPKGMVLGIRSTQPGKATVALLPEIVNQAVKSLPIPKPMRWGAKTTEFVRPVHWLLMLYGQDIVPAEILGQHSDRFTYGHRFMYPHPITVQSPSDYDRALLTTGFVMANFAVRREEIQKQVHNLAESLNAEAIIDESLLDEVTNIVEWPMAMACRFDADFLRVPQESLISSMQGHQKCFPLTRQGKLINHFITVSNIMSKQPESVVSGNEKVMRARLSDAAFFYDTDLKQPLDYYNEKLSTVTFQAKLGSLADKAQRVTKLTSLIANSIGSNEAYAKRAGELCKADLMTNMVGEFPELQGIMGRYYAQAYQEPAEVAAALDELYWPKFAGDKLPESATGQALSLADKLDTLVGIFGIGQKPTGSKDPFALRRAAIGALRILIEKQLPLDLKALLQQAALAYGNAFKTDSVVEEVLNFCFERLRAWYQEQGINTDVFEAAFAVQNTQPLDFHRRIQAVQEFKRLPEASSLIAANKRVHNILSKNPELTNAVEPVENLLQSEPERELFKAIARKRAGIKNNTGKANYVNELCSLADLKPTVDQFFDKVMVMVDDNAIRHNRLALLAAVRFLFLQVADISKLQE